MTNEIVYHVPVLLKESVDGLAIRPDGIYVDVTFGGGGHSKEILQRLGKNGHLYSFDQDADAERNIPGDERFTFVRSNFRYLRNWMRYYGVEQIDGLLADLGVSSHHLDDETRGFSFRFDAALDMRMNTKGGTTAAEIVNKADEQKLADIFYLYGELKSARRIAAAIVKARTAKPIVTTHDLLHVTEHLFQREHEKKDAARMFQALRIEVNHEMDALKDVAGCHRPDQTRRTLVGHHLPQSGRPHREECHEGGQHRGENTTRFLWENRYSLQGRERKSDRAQ